MLNTVQRRAFRPVSGFSLLEVLISLLILSVGLLGMAGLLIVSVRANHSAYQRTQATALAESMANRMRVNSRALWMAVNPYNGAYPNSNSTTTCTAAAPCDFAAVAARDGAIWSQELSNVLPNVAATINCVRNSGTVVADAGLRPPYDGNCSMTITWSEAPLDRGTTDPETPEPAPAKQIFAWVFQP